MIAKLYDACARLGKKGKCDQRSEEKRGKGADKNEEYTSDKYTLRLKAKKEKRGRKTQKKW